MTHTRRYSLGYFTRMATIRFSKMHGLGNDFMMVDATAQGNQVDWTPELVKRLSCRRTGIGFDQLLVVGAPKSTNADFSYRIFNANGTEAGQCGNGARAIAMFVRNKKLTQKDVIRLETSTAVMQLRVEANGLITVNMGRPCMEPAKVPFITNEQGKGEPKGVYSIEVDGESLQASVLSFGNPHAVLVVEDVETAPVEEIGSKLQQLACFPEKCNVGFMQVLSPSEVNLRVYERDAGETLACGSGACAAVVAGILRGLLEDEVTVHFVIGDLEICWHGDSHPLLMTGPAAHVYKGEIII